MKMARGLGWGPLVLPALSGDRVGYMTVWQGEKEVGNYALKGTEFQFSKMKRVVEIGCTQCEHT